MPTQWFGGSQFVHSVRTSQMCTGILKSVTKRHHFSSLKLAMIQVFTLWNLAATSRQSFSSASDLVVKH